ncbi:hypothetical protein BGW39_004991, partial [Mortierella sp. 14UC]
IKRENALMRSMLDFFTGGRPTAADLRKFEDPEMFGPALEESSASSTLPWARLSKAPGTKETPSPSRQAPYPYVSSHRVTPGKLGPIKSAARQSTVSTIARPAAPSFMSQPSRLQASGPALEISVEEKLWVITENMYEVDEAMEADKSALEGMDPEFRSDLE